MPRVLFVDDEPHIIRVMKLSIERAGYQLTSAMNGLQALESIREQQPDLLITDIDMPRMTGRELCMQIEDEFPQRIFPIYVLTSRAESEHREWSSKISNLEFLEKPVSMRLLLSQLSDYFSGAQSHSAS